eukprot:752414-Hanusia_phi.AAC.2
MSHTWNTTILCQLVDRNPARNMAISQSVAHLHRDRDPGFRPGGCSDVSRDQASVNCAPFAASSS